MSTTFSKAENLHSTYILDNNVGAKVGEKKAGAETLNT